MFCSLFAKVILIDSNSKQIGCIAIYLDLLASLHDISLEEAIIDTFNSKSDKYGFNQKISEVLSEK